MVLSYAVLSGGLRKNACKTIFLALMLNILCTILPNFYPVKILMIIFTAYIYFMEGHNSIFIMPPDLLL